MDNYIEMKKQIENNTENLKQANKKSNELKSNSKDIKDKIDKLKVSKLNGLIITKLDGTAKGGIALAVSSQLGLPIYRIGVGESIDDLQSFDAHDFCAALVGEGM